MKYKIKLSIAIRLFVIAGFSIILNQEYERTNRLSQEEKYQNILNQFDSVHHPDVAITVPSGPDKANLRDFVMTVDISQGYVPKENLSEIKNSKLLTRLNEDRDFNWQNLPTNVAGRARTFVVHPDNDKVFSGSVTGGLWVNDNLLAGDEWKPLPGFENTAISSLVYDPLNTDIMYMGTGESQTAFPNYRESGAVGEGIWKSLDGGQTWSLLTSTAGFSYVNDMVVRVEEGQSVIYAGIASGEYRGRIFNSTPTDGLYKSTDGGSNWVQVLPNIPGGSTPFAVSDIELTSNNKLFVGTMRNLATEGGGYILSSEDGLSWQIYEGYQLDIENLNNSTSETWIPGRVVLASAPSNGDRVYAIFMSGFQNNFNQLRDYSTALKRVEDNGIDWTEKPLPPSWANIPWHAASIAVDPNDENKILVGALNLYILLQADLNTNFSGSWIRLSDWSVRQLQASDVTAQSVKDSLDQFYIHADMHNIQFLEGSSDRVLITTDGGMFYTDDLTLIDNFDPEIGRDGYPAFRRFTNSLRTTQYYTVALNPTAGSTKVLGGTQDNGTLLSDDSPNANLDDLISGGDGAYCFWDEDGQFEISSAQLNRYFVHTTTGRKNIGFASGAFINPSDYDDNNNFLYTNLSAGRIGGLITSQKDRFYDTILLMNINRIVGSPDLGYDTLTYVDLGANILEPYSTLKLSPNTEGTMFLGTNFGKLIKTTGLPGNPSSQRIDNGDLPVGYISSIDVGNNDNTLLVTISNYGVESVWYSDNGGRSWEDIERNLPDMPVRWGIFNPYDDDKIMIATELGIWGLEGVSDETEQWQQYNLGLPDVRVDMIKVRKSDSTIAAATHGRGIFLGKFNQGASTQQVTSLEPQFTVSEKVYPNPAVDHFYIDVSDAAKYDLTNVELYSIKGELAMNVQYQVGVPLSVGSLKNGIYILNGVDYLGRKAFSRKLIVQH